VEIVSYVSVGDLYFGDSRRAVRRKLGASYSTFRKDVGEPLTDSYDDVGLHIYYDRAGRLQFIEAFEPNVITFREIPFIGEKFRTVLSKMSGAGFGHVETDAGIVFPDAGIVLSIEGKMVESMGAFCKGYYD
jgi:hypothetical protein